MPGAYQTSDFAYQGEGEFAYQTEETPSVSEQQSGRWQKRKPIRVRRADYVHQQEYEKAVAAALALAGAAIPLAKVTDKGFVIEDDVLEDDEIILLALTRILH